jgi:gas vesicle protein
MMSSDEGGGSFLSGFLLGGIVGAAVALLLTPRSGEENREDLRGRSIELKTKAEAAASRMIEETDDLPTRVKVVLEEQKSRVQEAIEEGKESAALKRAEMMQRYQISKQRGEAPLPDEVPPIVDGTRPGEGPRRAEDPGPSRT